jgi:hypothetical protein
LRYNNKEIARRLKIWYAKGEKGLLTLCETEGTPPAVKAQAEHWYKMGHVRFDALIKELEKNDDK